MKDRLRRRLSMPMMLAMVALLSTAFVAVAACTTTETVTVEVPVTTAPEVVVQTVVVERQGDVRVETVVQTVVVERPVEVRGETVVQTVVVDRVVDRQVVVTPTPTPRGEVGREDTLVVTGFGPGATQWDDPENMNPYSLGGLGRVRGILNKTIYEFLYLYNHSSGRRCPKR